MTTLMGPRVRVALPRIRQGVVDRLAALLAIDDAAGFSDAVHDVSATRAEMAAAAGLVESGALDLAALQHTLEVLEEVARLPDPGA